MDGTPAHNPAAHLTQLGNGAVASPQRSVSTVSAWVGGWAGGLCGRGGEGERWWVGWGGEGLFVVCCLLVCVLCVGVCVGVCVCVCVCLCWCVCVCVCVVCVCVSGVLVVCADFPCYSLSHQRKMCVLQDVREYVLDVNAYIHKIFLNLFEDRKVSITRVQRPRIAAQLGEWFGSLTCAAHRWSHRAFKHSGPAQKLGRRGPRSGQRISGMSVHVSQIELLLCGQHGA